VIHWSSDGWKTRQDVATRDTGLGIHTADLPTDGLVPGHVLTFTWKKIASDEWIGVDHTVTIGGPG
jgi:glucoamylase